MLVLHQADRFESSGNDHVHFVVENGVGAKTDGHHSRRTLPVDTHPRHLNRHPGSHSSQTPHVTAGCPLLQRTTENHILHLIGSDIRAFDSMGDGMGGQSRAFSVVPGAAIRFANWGSCGGYHDSLLHCSDLLRLNCVVNAR